MLAFLVSHVFVAATAQYLGGAADGLPKKKNLAGEKFVEVCDTMAHW